jgi:hypothetical protein
MQSWTMSPIYQREEPLNLGPLLFGLPAEKYTVQRHELLIAD